MENAESDAEQLAILSRLSPEARLRAAAELYWTARRLKEASLRQAHPEASDQEIKTMVNESFLYARE